MAEDRQLAEAIHARAAEAVRANAGDHERIAQYAYVLGRSDEHEWMSEQLKGVRDDILRLTELTRSLSTDDPHTGARPDPRTEPDREGISD